jgi:hypothetical protein
MTLHFFNTGKKNIFGFWSTNILQDRNNNKFFVSSQQNMFVHRKRIFLAIFIGYFGILQWDPMGGGLAGIGG